MYLFGGVRVAHHGDPTADGKITRRVKALLAYLLLHRHRIHPREVLAGLFWGDHSEERARSCLSTALWRLRRVLEPEGTARGAYLVTTPMGEVGFNRQSDHWLDVAEFEKTVDRCLTKSVTSVEVEDPCRLEDVLQLYTGDLLDGFYDDWALRERERLRSLYLKSLARLLHHYKCQKAYEKGLACGKQILDLEPLREGIHREMMRLYRDNGQRVMAIQQYKTCCRILDEELGIAPLEETQTLYHQIREGGSDTSLGVDFIHARGYTFPKKQPSLDQAFQKLHSAMEHFDKTREQLHHALQLLERMLK
jgi:DNA-binding SARP family transcriptional activator